MWKRIAAGIGVVFLLIFFTVPAMAEEVSLLPVVDEITFGFALSSDPQTYTIVMDGNQSIPVSWISYPFNKHFFRSLSTIRYDTEKYVRGDLISFSFSVNAHSLAYFLYSGVLPGTGISAAQRIGNRSFADYVSNHSGYITYFNPWVRVFSAPDGEEWVSLLEGEQDRSIIRIQSSIDNYESTMTPEQFYNQIKDYTPSMVYNSGVAYTVSYNVPCRIPLSSGDRFCFQVGFSHYATVKPYYSTVAESGFPSSVAGDPSFLVHTTKVRADLITNSEYQTELQSAINDAITAPYDSSEIDAGKQELKDQMQVEDEAYPDIPVFDQIFLLPPDDYFSGNVFKQLWNALSTNTTISLYISSGLAMSFIFFILRR